MGDCDEAAGFWLPSEFFTDDDFRVDNEIMKKGTTAGVDSSSGLCFPYYLETETHENPKNFWVMSTSPQSTLSNNGSWSSQSFDASSNSSPLGGPSPPATPLEDENDAVRELIHQAAGQVANLKLGGQGNFVPGSTKHMGIPCPHQFYAQHAKNPGPFFFQNSQLQQQNTRCGMYQSRNGKASKEIGQAAWTIQQNPTPFNVGSGTMAVLNNGSGGGGAVKKNCAGTGVFLPRSYGNIKNESNAYASDYLKKTGSIGLNRVFTKNYENLTGVAQSHPASQPRFDKGYIQDYESLISRRNAIMLQQRTLQYAERSSMLSRYTYLPQEWTY